MSGKHDVGSFLYSYKTILAVVFVAVLVSASAVNVAFSTLPTPTVATYNNLAGVRDCSYVISTNGASFYAQNCNTGAIDYSGTTASTVIDSAIDGATTGTIYIKAGTYPLTATINADQSGIQLVGEGLATVLEPDSGVDGITIGASDVQIRNLYISASLSGSGDAIQVNNGFDKIVIENNRIENAYHAVFVTGNNSEDIKVRNNIIVNSGRADGAIQFSEGSGSGTIRKVEISGNNIITPTSHGIEVLTTTAGLRLIKEVSIVNNVIDSPGHAGIFVSRTNGTIINGNFVTSADSESIDVEASASVVISSNRVLDGTLQGIVVIPVSTDYSYDITISSNVVQTTGASTGKGISVSNATRVSISNNEITATSNDGIYITGSGSDIIVTGNNVYKSGSAANTGIRLDLGAGKTGNEIIISNNRARGWTNGIQFGSGTITGVNVVGNDLTSNTNTIVFTVTPSSMIISKNQGFITENKGSGTLGSGATSATITHGLSYTPTAGEITITFTGNPTTDEGTPYVTNITATTFDLNVRNAPGASGLGYTWAVRRIG